MTTPPDTAALEEEESLCDRCGKAYPESETDTCEACGAQICDDCRPQHEEECCG